MGGGGGVEDGDVGTFGVGLTEGPATELEQRTKKARDMNSRLHWHATNRIRQHGFRMTMHDTIYTWIPFQHLTMYKAL